MLESISERKIHFSDPKANSPVYFTSLCFIFNAAWMLWYYCRENELQALGVDNDNLETDHQLSNDGVLATR